MSSRIIFNRMTNEEMMMMKSSFLGAKEILSNTTNLSTVNEFRELFRKIIKNKKIYACELNIERISTSIHTLELSSIYQIIEFLKTSIDIYKEIIKGSNISIIREKEKELREQEEELKIVYFPIKDATVKELICKFVGEAEIVYLTIETYEMFEKKFNELKEEQKKQDEDLVRMMEETKLTKDKRKQQEKQQAKNANQEHLRKKKEREEFYRKSGMLGAKPTKKSHKK